LQIIPIIGPIIPSKFHLIFLPWSESQIGVLVIGGRVNVPPDQLSF